MAPTRIIALILAATLLLQSAVVRAEQDFEYAAQLLSLQDPLADEMVERLIRNLNQDPATQTESRLIQAALNRHKAVNLWKTAVELEATDSIQAGKVRAEALGLLDKVSISFKAEAERAYPAFRQASERILQSQNLKEAPPKELIDPFNAWIAIDQQYLSSRIVQLECYEAGDNAQQALLGELSELCQTRLDDPFISDFSNCSVQYGYLRGRAYAVLGDEIKANQSWLKALRYFKSRDLFRKQDKKIIAKIVYDLVKLKMKSKKYSDVLEIAFNWFASAPLFGVMHDDLTGRDLIHDYAQALILSDASRFEYEYTVNWLSAQRDRQQITNPLWADTFACAVSELVDDANEKGWFSKDNCLKGYAPKFSAGEWYNAAHGFFLMGQKEHRLYKDYVRENPAKLSEQKEQFEKAYAQYQHAVFYYRRAILESRSEKAGLLTRLEIEPKCWFEMGLSYLKMEHYYEAIIAYKTFRDTFSPEHRRAWLPDPKGTNATPELKALANEIHAILNELDSPFKPKDGLLYKCGANIMFALDQNAFMHKNPEDHWNLKLKPLVLNIFPCLEDPSPIDLEYTSAKSDMENGRSYLKVAHEESNPKIAEGNYRQALILLIKAANGYSQVKSTSKAYEFALYQTATCFAQAQGLWSNGKLPDSPKDECREQTRELSLKALEAFQKYDEFTAITPAIEERDIARRNSVVGSILLTRVNLYSGALDWANVIQTAGASGAHSQLAAKWRDRSGSTAY